MLRERIKGKIRGRNGKKEKRQRKSRNKFLKEDSVRENE